MHHLVNAVFWFLAAAGVGIFVLVKVLKMRKARTP
jgi:hypothetical protein